MSSKKSKLGISAGKKLVLFRHLMVTFLAVAVMGLFAFLTVIAKPLDPVKRALQEFSFTDIYYEILNEGEPEDTSRIITIVDLTKLTRRSDIAATIEEIEKHHPKVLGVDCTFDNVGEDFEGNEDLIHVAEKYKNIVFADKMVDWAGDSVGWTKTIHSFFYEVTPIKEGSVNMPRTLYDRMKRRFPLYEKYHGQLKPSFVTQVADSYAEKDILRGRTGELNINFSPTAFRALQPEEVSKHPELIEDQIVLFGAMYDNVDTHWTPIGKMAGVNLLAYSIQSLVLSKEIKYVPLVPFCIITLVIIFLVQVVQSYYLQKTRGSKKFIVKYVVGASYFLNILTFLFLSVFIGISFLVFKLFNISYNMAWAVAVIAFLGTSRDMYASLKDYIKALKNKYKGNTNDWRYKILKNVKL